MKKQIFHMTLMLCGGIACFYANGNAGENDIQPSHGISYPSGWKNWGTIAVSHRHDNQTIG